MAMLAEIPAPFRDGCGEPIQPFASAAPVVELRTRRG
jgi:hypothetical protein